MRKSLIIAFVLAWSVGISAQGKVIDDSFFSLAMNQNRKVDVYLPPGYDAADTASRYPVVYFLHGAFSNENSYNEVIQAVNELISFQSIDPVIIVKPDASGGPASMSAYVNTPFHGNIEDYIIRDLVSYIDSTYNTMAQRDKRAIMGHSVGGYGCLRLALKYPDLFGSVASHAGFPDLTTDLQLLIPCALDENGGQLPLTNPGIGGCLSDILNRAYSFSPNLNNPPHFVDFPIDAFGNIIDSTWAKWKAHDASRLAAQYQASGRSDLAIYLTCGRQDDFLFASMRAFADSLQQIGWQYRFDEYDGGHGDQLLDRFRISLAFLDSAMWAGAIRPSHVTVNHTYAVPGLDTVIVVAHVPNPSAHNIDVSARITSLDKSVSEDLQLFDDGTHGDSTAADQIWSVAWPVAAGERTYSVAVQIVDTDNNLSRRRYEELRFTTIGPVVFAGFTKIRTGVINDREYVRGKIDLRNTSPAVTAQTITATLASPDTCIALVSVSNPAYNDILPGQAEATTGSYTIEINPNCTVLGEIAFDLVVASEGFELWRDHFTLALDEALGVTARTDAMPRDYALLQNYPNPFNPETTIKFELPEVTPVRITIYNLLGQLVRTLVDAPLSAGFHQVRWDGSNDAGQKLASGFYLYRMQSEQFIKTYKMLMLK